MLRDLSMDENLFLVIFELRLILVCVPAYTHTAYTSRVFWGKVDVKVSPLSYLENCAG